MAASQPATTHSRNAMCASISRSDGHALDGENDSAKITASPVSRVAKNAMLNCTESITSPRPSGVTMATISRTDRAARQGRPARAVRDALDPADGRGRLAAGPRPGA